MSDKTKQIESRQFSDDAIRRFFFGQLAEKERAEFEAALFADESFETRVRLAEYELADDYAFERLTDAGRVLFEKRFLITADRQSKLAVSNALCERLGHFAPALELKPVRRASLFEMFHRRRWQFAMVVVSLILLVVIGLLAKKSPRLNEIVWRKHPQKEREAEHPTIPITPPHKEVFPPAPPHDQTVTPTIVSVVLFPSTTQNSQTVVLLPRREQDIVRFQLNLQSNLPGPYRVEFISGRGVSIFSDAIVNEGGGKTIGFDVLARLLRAGDYRIRVSREDKTSEVAGVYYFQAR